MNYLKLFEILLNDPTRYTVNRVKAASLKISEQAKTQTDYFIFKLRCLLLPLAVPEHSSDKRELTVKEIYKTIKKIDYTEYNDILEQENIKKLIITAIANEYLIPVNAPET